MAKVIITCAITGGIHTPTLSAALPYRPADIAAQSIAAAQAGAAILHLHARDPGTGAPTGDPAVFAQFLPEIHDATDAVINLTTGGSPAMSPDDRLAAALHFSPEMCSLNMGSMNFSFHDMGRKITDWQFEWEDQYIRDSEKFIFRNTFADIARVAMLLADHGTRFEHECYDIGHLYNLAYLADKGVLKPPFFIQSVFGILGGIGADPDNVVFMRRTADRLFGGDYVWSVLGAGKHQMPIITQGAMLRRERSRRSGGQPVHRPRPAGGIERRTGREDRPHPRRVRPRARDAGRGARDAGTQGSRRGPLRMTRVAIIGAGLMGTGLCRLFTRVGCTVTAFDASAAAAAALHDAVPAARIAPTLADAAGDVDLVIEAASERLVVKRVIFAALATASGTDTILATNSSVISVARDHRRTRRASDGGAVDRHAFLEPSRPDPRWSR